MCIKSTSQQTCVSAASLKPSPSCHLPPFRRRCQTTHAKMNTVAVAFAAVLGCLVAASSTEAGYFGKCATPPVQQNFDLNKYLGMWYENLKYFSIPEHIMTCVSAKYSLNGTDIIVYNRGLVAGGYEDGVIFKGTASATEPARWAVSAPFVGAAPYLILDTDYTNYAVVYSCKKFGPLKNENLWILTRERKLLDETVKSDLYAKLESYGISTKPIKVENQNNCPAI